MNIFKIEKFVQLAIELKIDNNDKNLNIHIKTIMDNLSRNMEYGRVNFEFVYENKKYNATSDSSGWVWVKELK